MDNEIKISEEFILPRDLSAMAKKFFVQTEKSLKQDGWFIKKGSTVTGVKVIAAGENIGKIEFKTKEWSDDNAVKVQG